MSFGKKLKLLLKTIKCTHFYILTQLQTQLRHQAQDSNYNYVRVTFDSSTVESSFRFTNLIFSLLKMPLIDSDLESLEKSDNTNCK